MKPLQWISGQFFQLGNYHPPAPRTTDDVSLTSTTDGGCKDVSGQARSERGRSDNWQEHQRNVSGQSASGHVRSSVSRSHTKAMQPRLRDSSQRTPTAPRGFQGGPAKQVARREAVTFDVGVANIHHSVPCADSMGDSAACWSNKRPATRATSSLSKRDIPQIRFTRAGED